MPLLAATAVLFFAIAKPLPAAVCTFSQAAPFAIGEATESSRLAVSGVVGPVTKAVVALTDAGAPGVGFGGFTDLDLLIVPPAGQDVILASCACLLTDALLDLTFDKAASGPLPSSDQETGDECVSGSYLPSDYSGLCFGYLLSQPAPAAPYSTNLADLEATDPTGMWKLWGAAFKAGSLGQVASWELRLTATSCGTPTLVFADDFESGGCGWSGETGESPACL